MFNILLAAAAAAVCSITTPAHTVALVELYTSQGCSSCPPADRWLSDLPRRVTAERAVPLALHVGYWDHIGWKDPFARREFNQRQRRLADLNHNRVVYTPGVFVSGQEFDWRDQAAFARTVSAVNLRRAPVGISLSATGDGARAAVDVQVELIEAARGSAPSLYLALKQHGHRTSVSRGENRGATLRNDHVVREWLGPLDLRGRYELAFPVDGPSEFEVVAIVHDAGGQVLQAAALPLAGCTAAR
jgi:hypothetical protein